MTTMFLRLVDAPVDDKPAALRATIAALREAGGPSDSLQQVFFERDPVLFRGVPGSPFAYWVIDRVLEVFRLESFEGGGRAAAVGLQTSDDFRFVRTWWEVCHRERWLGFAKGGAFSPFYADIYLCVNWESDGHEMKAWAGSLYNESHWSRILKNTHLFGRPGLTWPRRTQGGFGIRAMPSACVFADKGPAAFVDGDNASALLALLAVSTSSAFRYLVELQMAFGSYEVGVIQRTPLPDITSATRDVLAELSRRAWSLKRQLDTTNETSHAFLLSPGLNESVTGLDVAHSYRELTEIQRCIDERVFDLYGIGQEDRDAILNGSSGSAVESTDDDSDEDPDDSNTDEPTVGVERAYSWLVGIIFGRFDPRLATGERMIPPEPEPFDPLPTRSPGMWPEGEIGALLPPSIVVDDMGHRDDFATLVAKASARVGLPDPHNLRAWLAREFFPLHIKLYSKSRRKAPIYWQLATPSASYSIWLYIHAFNRDTLFRVQNDYAATKLHHEERKLESLRQEHGANAGLTERRAIADQEAFVDELRGFLAEVRRVTPLWNPNLDDGVLLNFAPLWRLVPQNRAWQKELLTAWGGICNADYDWSHLAMHLWPERVVPKCATDRSLAIAHGLEAVFWVQSADGKWTARATPTRSIAELVHERSSPAVKAALTNLLEAPAATGGRVKRSRAATTITVDML